MATYKTKAALYTDERMWFFSLLFLLSVIFILYMYFVVSSVVQVVVRQELDRDIAEMHSYISQLETEYIEAQHAVSEDIALQKGYIAADHKVFIDRTPTTLVLSLPNES